MSPDRGPSHRPSRRRPPRSRACPPPVPRILSLDSGPSGAHPSDEGLVAARGSRVLARPTRSTARPSARRTPRGNDARATVHPLPPPRKPPAPRACPRNICTGPLSQRGRENLIVASVPSMPRPAADLRPDPSPPRAQVRRRRPGGPPPRPRGGVQAQVPEVHRSVRGLLDADREGRHGRGALHGAVLRHVGLRRSLRGAQAVQGHEVRVGTWWG